MFNLSPAELTILTVWAVGIVVAVTLILTKNLDLRARIIVLVAAIGLPVIGSLPVMLTGSIQPLRAEGKINLRANLPDASNIFVSKQLRVPSSV